MTATISLSHISSFLEHILDSPKVKNKLLFKKNSINQSSNLVNSHVTNYFILLRFIQPYNNFYKSFSFFFFIKLEIF